MTVLGNTLMRSALIRGLAAALVLIAMMFLAPVAAEAAGGGDDAHHLDYTGDRDGDGTPNWLDATDNKHPEAEVPEFVLLKLGFHLFNLLLLFAVLWWFGRGPIMDAVRGRSLSIRKELVDSARERDEAQERCRELEARLAQFEDEAKADEARVIQHAHEAATHIAETAERNIRDEVQRARIALQQEAVQLAVELAEDALKSRLEPEDHRRLAREFLQSLNQEVVRHG